ncbi:MAG TPA: ribonuclease P protein component [Anaerolineae bacterium]|jgi:ribonuclease P protein component
MLGRLHSSAEFERVKREGSFWAGRCCSLNAARQPTPSETADEPPVVNATLHTRVGLITSRKIGNAVQRNRARRLMRESMRQLSAMIGPYWDIVLIARPAISAPGVRMQDVRDEIQWLLTKARLAHPNNSA